MSITMLNTNNFEETIKSSTIPVIVDFYADWCAPCKRIAPALEEIANEKDGEVLVCKVDTDQNQELANSYQVMTIPTLISFKDGEIHKRVSRILSKEEILELLD